MEYVFGGYNALDDYSNLLTPDRLDDLYANIDGEFVGLGVEMTVTSRASALPPAAGIWSSPSWTCEANPSPAFRWPGWGRPALGSGW